MFGLEVDIGTKKEGEEVVGRQGLALVARGGVGTESRHLSSKLFRRGKRRIRTTWSRSRGWMGGGPSGTRTLHPQIKSLLLYLMS